MAEQMMKVECEEILTSSEEGDDVVEDVKIRDPFFIGMTVDTKRCWTEHGLDFVSTVLQQAKNVTNAANAATAAADALNARASPVKKSPPKQREPRKVNPQWRSSSPEQVKRENIPLTSKPFEVKQPENQPTKQRRRRTRINGTNERKVAEAAMRNNMEGDLTWIRQRTPVFYALGKYLGGLAKDLTDNANEFYSSVNIPPKKEKERKKTKDKNKITSKDKCDPSKNTCTEPAAASNTDQNEDKLNKMDAQSNERPTDASAETLRRKIPVRRNQEQVAVDGDHDSYELAKSYNLTRAEYEDVIKFVNAKELARANLAKLPSEDPHSSVQSVQLSQDHGHTIAELKSEGEMHGNEFICDDTVAEGESSDPGRESHPVLNQDVHHIPYKQSHKFSSPSVLSFETMSQQELGLHLEAMDEDEPYSELEFINGDIIYNDNEFKCQTDIIPSSFPSNETHMAETNGIAVGTSGQFSYGLKEFERTGISQPQQRMEGVDEDDKSLASVKPNLV